MPTTKPRCFCDNKNRFVCYGNIGGGGCPCDCHNRTATKNAYPVRKSDIPREYKLILGQRLQAARDRAAMSQNEVTRLLGWPTNANISQYEAGRHAPTNERLESLCKVYNVSKSEIIAGLNHPVIEQRYT